MVFLNEDAVNIVSAQRMVLMWCNYGEREKVTPVALELSGHLLMFVKLHVKF